MTEALVLAVRADSRQGEADIKRFGGAVRGLAGDAGVAGAGFARLGTAAGIAGVAIAGLAAGRAAVSWIVEAGIGFGKLADDLQEQAAAAGISTQSLQVWQEAAHRVGVEAGAVQVATRTLSKAIVEAATGAGPAAQAMARFEGSVRDLTTGALRPTEEVLLAIADGIKRVGSGAQTTADLTTLLGRSGSALLPAMQDGAAGVEELRSKMEDLGVILDDQAIALGVEYADAVDDLELAYRGLRQEIGRFVLPTLTAVVAVAKTAVAELRPMREVLDSVGKVGLWETLKGAMGAAGGEAGIPLLNEYLRALTAETVAVGAAANDATPPLDDVADRIGAVGSRAVAARLQVRGLVDEITSVPWVDSDIFAPGGPETERRDRTADDVDYTLASEANERITRNTEEHQARRAAAAQAARDAEARGLEETEARYRAYGSVIESLGQMTVAVTEIVGAAYGRQSDEAKQAAQAAFVVGKAVALAGAIVDTARGVAAGVAAGYPAAIPLVAAAAVSGAAAIATIVATTVAGGADPRVTPDMLRSAGLNRHTVLAVRNDEAVLDPTGTKLLTQDLHAAVARLNAGGANGGPVRITTQVVLDGRVLGEAVDERLIRQEERGLPYRDRIRGVA